MKNYSIAIDGPAGAGKSTVAKKVAQILNFIYIDTGAMYRTIGYYCLHNNIDVDTEEDVNNNLDAIDIKIKFVEGMQRIFLNEVDITDLIRTQEVGEAASKVSVYKEVRTRLVSMQQEIAKKENVVMDGRDIGTVVLPNATLKIFLTASSLERAKRRCKELEEKGIVADLEITRREIEERDYRDSHRENSPLKQADDAILIDSSNMTIEEEIDNIINLYKKRLENEKNDK